MYHYTNIAGANFVRADVNIFLEVVMPNVLSTSRENWLVPNCEWWHPANDRFLPQFTKILAKTRDCERIWREKLKDDRPERVVYTGFECRDLYDEKIPREMTALHLAGDSEFKGTEAVIAAWKKSNWVRKPIPLTVITRQKKYQDMCAGSNIILMDRVDNEHLPWVLNSHRFHVMPSAYEGYGHSVHEGIMCGGLVITTAAPPMSEFAGVQADWGVRSLSITSRSLATLRYVTPDDICVAMCRALEFVDRVEELDRRATAVRRTALAERDAFRKVFLELIGV